MSLIGSRRVLLGTPGLPTPALDLDFLTGTMPSGITFTRASAGWAYNSSGVLTSSATNSPRLDYDPATLLPRGLLIEEARTNLFLNSAVGVTQSCTVAAAANTLSFFGTGTITLTGTSTAGPLVGTGATTRVSLTFTPTAGSLTLTVSGSVTNVQLELGVFASSPIVTVGSTVTRAIDTAVINPLGSWFSATAGTVMAEFQREGIATGGLPRVVSFSDGTTGNLVELLWSSSNEQYSITTASASQATMNLGNGGTALNRVAAAWAVNDAMACLNGALGTPDTSVTLPTVDRLHIGNRSDLTAARQMSGYIRRIRYWPTRLPDATLRRLTS